VIRIDRYSLEAHAGPYKSWPTTSLLRVDGRQTGARVPGYVIEAQYESPLGDLLITSFDCLFEESNSFVLLDQAYSVVTQTELLVPYSTFLLHEHWVIDASTIGLHYHEAMFYTLRILPPLAWLNGKPRLRLRRRLAWWQDARMREAHDRLQAALAEIAASNSEAYVSPRSWG
jgi:hypothetical protein